MVHDPTTPPSQQGPDNEEKAKARFMTINVIRVGGVLMILAAIAVVEGVLPLPRWTAYLLAVLGLVEAFLVPQILARIWSSNDRTTPHP